MANVTTKPNGTYLVRISCGRDIMTGKQILRGRIFKPSKTNLSQKRFEKELNEFKRLPSHQRLMFCTKELLNNIFFLGLEECDCVT